ncbi:hypothetical protein MKP08_08255 [Erythrobacter sp. LQ02-29]|uniref:hypothetical protein n=1 Tax=Erythrobacter sp. LQ02-29 TaxID=2920384 RepID=UPI001F4D62F4|nr:hypothetical protein [Erythrobacter sp. LQ02-29]MCP9222735.1 hypothetical protein [Erythrobacter sp. LQ02-29]
MRGLTILCPLPFASVTVSDGTGAAYLSTPDPKEVWRAGALRAGSIEVDLGATIPIDTAMLGFTNAAATATWAVTVISADRQTNTVIHGPATMRVPGAAGARFHALALAQQPVEGRFVRFTFTQAQGAPALEIGLALVGLRAEHAYEWRSGRRPIDLGERVDLAGGGFGFGSGAIKGSYRFTAADLSDAEVEDLWNTIMEVGVRRPVLLVEGGDNAVSHNRIHYGVFERFEPYERADAADTRWALTLQDWI